MDDRLSIGVDLGQRVDYTCAAVVETIGSRRFVRVLKQLPLGTSYPKIVDFIVKLLFADVLTTRDVLVRIDCTGIGTPVVDMLRERLSTMDITDRRIELEPLSFRHGETYNREAGTIGKMYLVSNLQALLQQNLVWMDDTSESRALVAELLDYQIHIDDGGKDTYGVFRTGRHDDMATALALACLPMPNYTPLAGYEVKSEDERAEESKRRAEEHKKKIAGWRQDPFSYPYLRWDD